MGDTVPVQDKCAIVDTVSRIVKSRSGARLGFHEGHVLLGIILLEKEGPLGRKLLYRKLGVTETSARSLVRRLSAQGLVSVDRVAGAFLTERGEEAARLIRGYIKVERNGDGFVSSPSYVIALRDTLFNDEPVMNIRDMIISSGAREAVVAYVDGEASVPGLPPQHSLYRRIAEAAKKYMEPWSRGTVVFTSIDGGLSEAYRVAYILLRHRCWRERYC